MAKKNDIQQTAAEFQKFSAKIKEIEAKMKPLKQELIAYGEDHQRDFDCTFRLKFDCGAYLSQRVKDVLVIPDGNETDFTDNLPANFVETKPNEAKILGELSDNNELKKLLKNFGVQKDSKVTIAVYAK